MKTSPLLLSMALAALFLTGAGCSTAAKKPVYTTGQTGQIIREEAGEIVAVRDVVIKPEDLGIFRGGPGRQIGSAVGRSVVTGSVIGAAAAIGGVIGGEIGSKADERAGEEITIRLKGTEEVVIVVQERGDTPLAPGEKIKVQTAAGTARGMPGQGGGRVRVVRAESQFTDRSPTAADGVTSSRAAQFVSQ